MLENSLNPLIDFDFALLLFVALPINLIIFDPGITTSFTIISFFLFHPISESDDLFLISLNNFLPFSL